MRYFYYCYLHTFVHYYLRYGIGFIPSSSLPAWFVDAYTCTWRIQQIHSHKIFTEPTPRCVTLHQVYWISWMTFDFTAFQYPPTESDWKNYPGENIQHTILEGEVLWNQCGIAGWFSRGSSLIRRSIWRSEKVDKLLVPDAENASDPTGAWDRLGVHKKWRPKVCAAAWCLIFEIGR